MSRPLATRKRTAQGTSSPLVNQQQFGNIPYTAPQDPAAYDHGLVDWLGTEGLGNLNNQFVDNTGIDGAFYDSGINGDTGFGGANVQNGQLVRRPGNQQMVARNLNTWQDPGGGAVPMPEVEPVEDEEELEQQALAAKKDAQAKRKQIPPFVQKLSSFLDNGHNTDLIRWSNAGDSFIVLDEDEFAHKLIPELFKHNNYASFVRQLNMYGFHKKVGLSDNSMKASENKRKTPSEYYNKYFRRGRPELLWLIQKPKNAPPAKRKREDKGDSDEEQSPPLPEASIPSKMSDSKNGTTDLTVIPKTELTSLRQELAGLQKQQKMITQVIQQMKQQNDQFYRQATAFQDMHQRHENSINAILTFLATFYNRSLEGQNQTQNNMNDMFNPSLPSGNVQGGNIVDIGDMAEEMQMPVRRPHRQPLLLPAPPELRSETDTPVSPATMQTRSTVSPRPRNANAYRQNQAASTTPTASSAPTPAMKYEADSPSMVTDNSGMMSVINAANNASPSNTGPGLDFDSALHHFQNRDGNTPLTQQQRNDMLSMMNSLNTASGGTNAANSALTHPQTPPLPSLNQISTNNDQLEHLQRLAAEHGENVQSLRDRITSLSPSGFVPGLDNGTNQPPEFDLDDWFQSDSGNDPNFDNMFGDGEALPGAFPDLGTGDQAANPDLLNENDAKYAGGRVESISSRGTSPASPAVVTMGEGEVVSPRKRRKGN